MKTRQIACALLAVSVAAVADNTRHASIPVATRDGKRILFQSDRDGRSQIYVMNADGKGERRLTKSAAEDMGGDWSPDGAWIVFSSYIGESTPMQLVRINSDGSGRTVLASLAQVSWPKISPDGRRIAFTGGDGKSPTAIFIVNPDGTGLQRFPTGLRAAWDPEWSPDGRRLLFAEFPADLKQLDKTTSRIFIADISGANRRFVAEVPGLIQMPRWSPDGRVAFQTFSGGKDANIVVLGADSGVVRTLTHHERPYLDETPSWLPDGDLLFQSNRSGSFEIYRMKPDGSRQRRIS